MRTYQNVLYLLVDGEWSSWQPMGICSASCGGGMQGMYRMCDNPSPYNGGLMCELSDGSGNRGMKDIKMTTCGISPCQGTYLYIVVGCIFYGCYSYLNAFEVMRRVGTKLGAKICSTIYAPPS